MNAIELTQALIKCPSVTPADAGALPLLAKYLEGAGFTCHMLPFGEINNLYATIGSGSPHIMYAGHTDVVPTGPLDKWTHPPFEPVLYTKPIPDGGEIAPFPSPGDEIDPDWLNGVQTIGITAGASAPEKLVREVIDRFSEWCDVEEETVKAAEEKMVFKLPRQLVD